MMYSEFYERTKTDVSYEEYRIIEDSYYDFDGNKDEFCKQWLKDKKSGRWELELILRMTIRASREHFENTIKEKDETIEFYRGYVEEMRAKIEKLEGKLAKIADAIAE